jgi:hypothetical protein
MNIESVGGNSVPVGRQVAVPSRRAGRLGGGPSGIMAHKIMASWLAGRRS